MTELHGSTEALAKTATSAPACTMVIFGADGDLTRRLLMPALYNLGGTGLLDEKFSITGVDRDEGTDANFQGREPGAWGKDGHTASLFPGVAALGDHSAWTAAVIGAKPQPDSP